ncbi:MAG: glycosyltransferase [Gemmatimonadaceae bacterium]|nr:glycosyltransferase [Gemmatimonadaceae bacterium]
MNPLLMSAEAPAEPNAQETSDGTPPSVAPSAPTQTLRIMFLIGEFGIGGAERQALALASALRDLGHEVQLVALKDGPLRASVETAEIPFRVLARPFRQSLASVPALRRMFRTQRPHVVYAFLDLQWLLAIAARGRARMPRVVLGIRSSEYGVVPADRRGRIVHWLTRRFSGSADLLVANSALGLYDFAHHARDVPPGLVVPNGIDLARFAPLADVRAAQRAAWGLPSDAEVIGHVGRLHPVKQHERLLDAFAVLRRTRAHARLVCVGDGPVDRVAALRRHAESLGIADAVTFVGGFDDVARAYNTFDVLALCSAREGFPNVVAEGMACGVPAVVTDVGACADIVGEHGEVVADADSVHLAQAMERLLNRRSPALSARCRDHVLSSYTLSHVAQRTAEVFAELAAGRVSW